MQLYDALLVLSWSPVVAINRALAIAEMHGASAALEAIQEIAGEVALIDHQPYWAARADLLAKTGAHGEARHAYEIAIGLERDPRFAASYAAVSRPWRLDPPRCRGWPSDPLSNGLRWFE